MKLRLRFVQCIYALINSSTTDGSIIDVNKQERSVFPFSDELNKRIINNNSSNVFS